MNTNQKILDILIAEMGAEAIMAICKERMAAVASSSAASSAAAPQKPAVILKGKVAPKKVEPPKTPEKKVESEEAPKAPVKILPSKKIVVKKIEPVVKNLEPVLEEAQEEPKKSAGRPKKVVAEIPRCDARIYGEQIEIEGTKAPNGKPLHAYKHAQCERKGYETLAIPEEGEPRHLKEGEEVPDDEGKFHLCKVCIKRWEARAESGDNWHGFFDDDGAPETSHFIGGVWYTKKVEAAKAKEAEAEKNDE